MKKNHTPIVNEAARLSKGPIAQQYKTHQPLSSNSGSALPIASADIERAGSGIDNITEPDSGQWNLSVMHLADHYKNEPVDVFLLLEQSNYAGQHIIHHIRLDNDQFKVASYVINPQDLGNIGEVMFGKVHKLVTKSSYYVSSYILSQEDGRNLLALCNKTDHTKTITLGNAYQSLHKLAKNYVNNEDKKILEMDWSEYIKQPEVLEYEKD